MSKSWSVALAMVLASCGGAGRAVPAEVEIDWPDAGTQPQTRPAPEAAPQVDAGASPTKVEDGGAPEQAPTAP